MPALHSRPFIIGLFPFRVVAYITKWMYRQFEGGLTYCWVVCSWTGRALLCSLWQSFQPTLPVMQCCSTLVLVSHYHRTIKGTLPNQLGYCLCCVFTFSLCLMSILSPLRTRSSPSLYPLPSRCDWCECWAPWGPGPAPLCTPYLLVVIDVNVEPPEDQVQPLSVPLTFSLCLMSILSPLRTRSSPSLYPLPSRCAWCRYWAPWGPGPAPLCTPHLLVVLDVDIEPSEDQVQPLSVPLTFSLCLMSILSPLRTRSSPSLYPLPSRCDWCECWAPWGPGPAPLCTPYLLVVLDVDIEPPEDQGPAPLCTPYLLVVLDVDIEPPEDQVQPLSVPLTFSLCLMSILSPLRTRSSPSLYPSPSRCAWCRYWALWGPGPAPLCTPHLLIVLDVDVEPPEDQVQPLSVPLTFSLCLMSILSPLRTRSSPSLYPLPSRCAWCRYWAPWGPGPAPLCTPHLLVVLDVDIEPPEDQVQPLSVPLTFSLCLMSILSPLRTRSSPSLYPSPSRCAWCRYWALWGPGPAPLCSPYLLLDVNVEPPEDQVQPLSVPLTFSLCLMSILSPLRTRSSPSLYPLPSHCDWCQYWALWGPGPAPLCTPYLLVVLDVNVEPPEDQVQPLSVPLTFSLCLMSILSPLRTRSSPSLYPLPSRCAWCRYWALWGPGPAPLCTPYLLIVLDVDIEPSEDQVQSLSVPLTFSLCLMSILSPLRTRSSPSLYLVLYSRNLMLPSLGQCRSGLLVENHSG